MEMNKKNFREIAHYVIGLLVILGVIYIVRQLFKAEIPTANRDAAMMTIGAILGWGGAVVSYYFGSSKGSSDKTESMLEKKL